MTDFTYGGAELKLFASAHNWKAYWSGKLLPFIAGDVLEVGAGIGSNVPYLDPGRRDVWVCLEPDARLAAQMTENLAPAEGLNKYEIVAGAIKSLDHGRKFDTIIYIDVLEHIENDKGEMEDAASILQAGGRIIVLAPAHQSLFTPFDAAIGHFRRYNSTMLRAVMPRGLRLEKLFYLDSAGLALSLANRVLLRQSVPTAIQLKIWDQWAIPISRVLDKCLLHCVGRSIVAVWRLS